MLQERHKLAAEVAELSPEDLLARYGSIAEKDRLNELRERDEELCCIMVEGLRNTLIDRSLGELAEKHDNIMKEQLLDEFLRSKRGDISREQLREEQVDRFAKQKEALLEIQSSLDVRFPNLRELNVRNKIVEMLMALEDEELLFLKEEISPPEICKNIFTLTKIYKRIPKTYYIGSEAMRDIATELLRESGDYKKAIEIAENISKVSIKAETMKRIAVILTELGDLHTALGIVESKILKEAQSYALRDIVKVLIQTERFGEATEVANGIPNERTKSWALHDIVKVLIQTERFREAAEAANGIPNERTKSRDLDKIAQAHERHLLKLTI